MIHTPTTPPKLDPDVDDNEQRQWLAGIIRITEKVSNGTSYIRHGRTTSDTRQEHEYSHHG